MADRHIRNKRMTAALLICIAAAVIYRIVRILYSAVYVDASFTDGFVSVMYYASAAAEGIMWGSFIAAISCFAVAERKPGVRVMIPVAASLAVSHIGGLVYDVASSSVKGLEVAAVLNVAFRILLELLISFLAFPAALGAVKSKQSTVRGLLMRASGVVLAAALLSRTAELAADLIKNSFSITPLEALYLAGEYVEVFLMNGVLVFLAARLIWELFSRAAPALEKTGD